MRPHPDDFLTRRNAMELLSLGTVLKVGMVQVENSEKFAGAELDHSYHTHFPMPDGVEWEVTLRKRKL